MAEASGVDRLELQRWGLRFTRRETESSYVAWQRERTMVFNRAAIYAAFCGLVFGLLTLTEIRTARLAPVFGAMVVLAVTCAGLLVMTHRPATFGWVHPAVAFGNGLFGATMVFTYSWVLDAIELSAGAVLLTSFFAFAVNRVRPAHAAVATGAYLALQAALVLRAVSTARLDADMGLMEVWLLLIAFATGLMIALLIDADGRRAYRQEQIIEAQKVTIARERARSEELLKKELSHQVAERSRELGAVLARSDVTLDVRRLSPGERFAERYKILSALGAGGMGAVYEVERVTDGATLALKAVVGEVSGASAARFAREAEIGARVHHPNLVSIVDVGVSAGVPFLAMELVRGGSLEAQRARFGDVAWARPILRQVAEGLAALHDAGVVHRDLKPANVLLADGGIAKISDFGISRFGELDDASADPNAPTMAATSKKSAELTGTGVVMGTPLYMAPEGARSARALDASADVFAFGIIAYEMLTGKSPFAVPAFVLAMAEQPIPAPPAMDDARVPRSLASVVAASLASDAIRRPRARAILDALRPD